MQNDPLVELVKTIREEAQAQLPQSKIYQVQIYQWKNGAKMNDIGSFHHDKKSLSDKNIIRLLSENIVSLHLTYPEPKKCPWEEGAYCMTILWGSIEESIYMLYTTIFLDQKGSFTIRTFKGYTNKEIARLKDEEDSTTIFPGFMKSDAKITKVDGFFDPELIAKLTFDIRGSLLAKDLGIGMLESFDAFLATLYPPNT